MSFVEGFSRNTEVPPLPERVVTRDGIDFDPRPDRWRLRGLARTQTMDFLEFSHLSSKVVLRLKWLFIVHLKEKSFSHSTNLYSEFLHFYRTVLSMSKSTCDQIELSHVLTFKARLDNATEWKLGLVRIVLMDMNRLGFNISSSDVLEYLDSATIRGNIKGTSIRTRDPGKGAFNDIELLSIQSALNDAYASGKIELDSFALAWVLLAYGCRAIQIAAMKEKDLLVSETSEGKSYALRIPRGKQKGNSYRHAFNTRYCSKQIGELLERVIASNALKREMLQLEKGEAPLFIGRNEGALRGLAFHRSSGSIAQSVERTINGITGLKGNSKRFRITLGQRAADDGKGKWELAELLDHSDTQNVSVYYESAPQMVMRLDRHLAMELAPLAQAFAGVVVETEDEAFRGSDRSSRIYDRTLADNVGGELGTCGQMSFCGLAAPYACYTCRHFQPWVYGPHEEFMAAMLADRKRQEDNGISPKIFTIRDRAIAAAAEVIRLCSEKKATREALA